MRHYRLPSALLLHTSLFAIAKHALAANTAVDLQWYPPSSSQINSISSAINGNGTYGYIYNSSALPPGVPYGTYDWCNMPHVRTQEYPRVNTSFELQYVEVIHRHHKRTPYASNTFPHEEYAWYCDDEGLYYFGAPLPTQGANKSASPYWAVYTSDSNPFAPQGFNGTCQFPQITRGGLDDSWQHGKDIFSVYHDLLGFIPKDYDSSVVAFRVTNNVITSQVAGMLLGGMYPDQTRANIPLLIQPDSVDSLEPAYSCSAADTTYSAIGSPSTGSTNSSWQAHLTAAAPLYARLDSISGIASDDSGWHVSMDHYYDSLSARLCHAKPLPCNGSRCVSQADADEVFRLGLYEYSYTYRDAGQQALDAAVASYGVYVAELAQNLRHAMGHGPSSVGNSSNTTSESVRYRHNVAHDGSVSRLLAILQVDRMVWPGMGSEVVFELYKATGLHKYFARVLWGGQVLQSSNPSLGAIDMLPAETLLAYFDGLVGVGASKVPGLCASG